jgi:hypothetical protein
MQLDNSEIWHLVLTCALLFIPIGIFLANPVKKAFYRFVARGAARRKVRNFGSVQDWLDHKKHEDWK